MFQFDIHFKVHSLQNTLNIFYVFMDDCGNSPRIIFYNGHKNDFTHYSHKRLIFYRENLSLSRFTTLMINKQHSLGTVTSAVTWLNWRKRKLTDFFDKGMGSTWTILIIVWISFDFLALPSKVARLVSGFLSVWGWVTNLLLINHFYEAQ